MVERVCPQCRSELRISELEYVCVACAEIYSRVDGIDRFMPGSRVAHFERFLNDYTTVRLAEGRASEDPNYFRDLPATAPGAPMEWQWNMRRRSWQTVRTRIFRSASNPLVVVDVGAGVGWLSNRVTELGHVALAVDLTVDAHDGLGAARHFERSFSCSQAEMDSLPFADSSADIVIYNASLHYSCDYAVTFAEALRVLKPTGRIVVMDSPIYKQHSAGERMIAERHADFEQRFGSRSDSVPSVGYLTPAMLRELSMQLGLRWRRHHTWYGWQWAWKPWRARLRGKRQPSRFVVLVATRVGPSSATESASAR